MVTVSFTFVLLCTPYHISVMSFVRKVNWDARSCAAHWNKFLPVSNSSWKHQHRSSGKAPLGVVIRRSHMLLCE